MSGDGGPEDFHEAHEAYQQESFGRPFLGRVIRTEAEAFPAAAVEETPDGHNRPYLLTGGRTGGGAAGVGIETVLVLDRAGAQGAGELPLEMTMIARTCAQPVAVAEVAARLSLPVGVVQVLAGDLVAAGVLQRSASSASLADDVAFIERLIHGVSAL